MQQTDVERVTHPSRAGRLGGQRICSRVAIAHSTANRATGSERGAGIGV